MNQSKLKAMHLTATKCRKTYSAARLDDWMAARYEFREPIPEPIVKRSNAETKQLRITFNTQVKTTLSYIC